MVCVWRHRWPSGCKWRIQSEWWISVIQTSVVQGDSKGFNVIQCDSKVYYERSWKELRTCKWCAKSQQVCGERNWLQWLQWRDHRRGMKSGTHRLELRSSWRINSTSLMRHILVHFWRQHEPIRFKHIQRRIQFHSMVSFGPVPTCWKRSVDVFCWMRMRCRCLWARAECKNQLSGERPFVLFLRSAAPSGVRGLAKRSSSKLNTIGPHAHPKQGAWESLLTLLRQTLRFESTYLPVFEPINESTDCFCIPTSAVVPHKVVAEVSKIGNLYLLWEQGV